jgi:RNA polymerase sigma-70 factor (ECF subfamily)
VAPGADVRLDLPIVPPGDSSFVNAIATWRIRALPVLSGPVNVTYSQAMSEHLDDSALMLRYKDGDTASFETLYRRHNDSLFRYLLRLSRNRASAEDVYQEVWRKTIESRQRYRPTAKFRTFLFRVAQNCFIDHTRRNKRYSTIDLPDYAALQDEGDGPDVAAEKILFRRRMDAAIAALPEEQRQAFLLHEEAGLDLGSIAAICGTTRETVKSRLRYANDKLKRALAKPTAVSDGQSGDSCGR